MGGARDKRVQEEKDQEKGGGRPEVDRKRELGGRFWGTYILWGLGRPRERAIRETKTTTKRIIREMIGNQGRVGKEFKHEDNTSYLKKKKGPEKPRGKTRRNPSASREKRFW